MLKKILSVAVTGVSALGFVAANAALPGPYITGQLGYADTHLRGKIALPAADIPGHQINIHLTNNGFMGRVAAGYLFDPNFGVELGYSQLRSVKSREPNTAYSSYYLGQNAVDLATKGIWPVASNFDVYAKIGVAYLSTNVEAKDQSATCNLNDKVGIARHKWAPEAAVGVDYNVTQNVFIDTAVNHIQVLGKNRPGNIDTLTFGLGYRFG